MVNSRGYGRQDNASTEAVSARLRQLAPAIYRAEHALSSRASELLVQARAASSASERERLQREALQLAKQVAGQLQLPAVCRQFQVPAAAGAQLLPVEPSS